MSNAAESREALRKKLKDKIRSGRRQQDDAVSLRQRMRNDPTTTLLSLGIDDPTILEHSKLLATNPRAALQAFASSSPDDTSQLVSAATARAMQDAATHVIKGAAPPSTTNRNTSRAEEETASAVDSDEEEAPPLLR